MAKPNMEGTQRPTNNALSLSPANQEISAKISESRARPTSIISINPIFLNILKIGKLFNAECNSNNYQIKSSLLYSLMINVHHVACPF